MVSRLMAVKKTTNTKETNEFAVLTTGGKQYKVAVGDVVRIEKLDGEFKKGDKIVFDKVLLVDNGQDTTIGTPYISGAKVETIFEEAGRYDTVTVIKYRQKSRYFKKNGHRQPYMEVKVSAIK